MDSPYGCVCTISKMTPSRLLHIDQINPTPCWVALWFPMRTSQQKRAARSLPSRKFIRKVYCRFLFEVEEIELFSYAGKEPRLEEERFRW